MSNHRQWYFIDISAYCVDNIEDFSLKGDSFDWAFCNLCLNRNLPLKVVEGNENVGFVGFLGFFFRVGRQVDHTNIRVDLEERVLWFKLDYDLALTTGNILSEFDRPQYKLESVVKAWRHDLKFVLSDCELDGPLVKLSLDLACCAWWNSAGYHPDRNGIFFERRENFTIIVEWLQGKLIIAWVNSLRFNHYLGRTSLPNRYPWKLFVGILSQMDV